MQLPRHTCGAGNLGKFHEKLRETRSVGLPWGPESKPVLDPQFPAKGSTDTGKYIDFTRFLECANGGAFEWGTAAEEKEARRTRERKAAAVAAGEGASASQRKARRTPSC